MFSAGDSSGDGINSLNQFTNMHGTVDWAALAQQWIQMRDTNTNIVGMPDAPPPPKISGTYNDVNSSGKAAAAPIVPNKKATFEEKGEADMDMDEEDEHQKRVETPPPPAPSMHISRAKKEIVVQHQAPWFMQQQQQQGAIQAPVTNIPGVKLDIENGSAHAVVAAPPWNANVWPPRMTLPPPTAIIPTAQLTIAATNPTAHIPSLMKINIPNPNTMKTVPPNPGDQSSTTVLMDAAKRKILPAWIREGLEKMEREKQKQLERQQQQSSMKENIDGQEVVQNELMQTVKTNNTTILESDSSGNEDDEVEPSLAVKLVQKIEADEDASDVSGAEIETDAENEADHSYVGKRSYEEKLSDLMIVVRTTLTELLLEVTNAEISSIAHEAVNSRKAKASSAQVIRKSALTSITSKLGLAAYADSSSDDSSASENEASADNDHNYDSEEDIKASIRMKRRAFAKISEEIEESIAVSAAREEQKLKYYTQMEKQERQDGPKTDDTDHTSYSGKSKGTSASTTTVSKAYERDFGETTETKLQHSNGKRQKERISRKERTTRFSDNKDSKSATIAAAAAATYMSQMQSSSTSTVANANQNATVSLFPITTISSASTSTVASPADSANIYSMSANLSDGASVINKSLLNAAEAAFDKVTKSKSSLASSSEKRHHRSRHERDRDYERDRDRERQREQERVRNRERERERERRHGSHRSHGRYSSDDEKSSSSSSSDSSSSSSHSSRHSKYSRSSSTRHQHAKSARSSSKHKSSRSRSHDRHHRRRKHRSSLGDCDDDISRHRNSSSRHSTRPSSKKRSRSRSRSTYSSSSRRHRH